MVIGDEIKTNGQGIDTNVIDTTELRPNSTTGISLFSAHDDSNNPGTRVLAHERDETSFWKSLYLPNDRFARDCLLATEWYNRHNKTHVNDHKINAIKLRAVQQMSIQGRGIKTYAETAIGIATTDTNWKPFRMPWSREKEMRRDGNEAPGRNGLGSK